MVHNFKRSMHKAFSKLSAAPSSLPRPPSSPESRPPTHLTAIPLDPCPPRNSAGSLHRNPVPRDLSSPRLKTNAVPGFQVIANPRLTSLHLTGGCVLESVMPRQAGLSFLQRCEVTLLPFGLRNFLRSKVAASSPGHHRCWRRASGHHRCWRRAMRLASMAARVHAQADN